MLRMSFNIYPRANESWHGQRLPLQLGGDDNVQSALAFCIVANSARSPTSSALSFAERLVEDDNLRMSDSIADSGRGRDQFVECCMKSIDHRYLHLVSFLTVATSLAFLRSVLFLRTSFFRSAFRCASAGLDDLAMSTILRCTPCYPVPTARRNCSEPFRANSSVWISLRLLSANGLEHTAVHCAALRSASRGSRDRVFDTIDHTRVMAPSGT